MGEEKSLMEDLAEAWDELENTEDSTDGELDQQQELSPVQTEDKPAGLEDSGNTDDDPGVPGDQNEIAAEGAEDDKPPVALPPAAREEWKNTPEPIRKHIAENEKRMENMAQKYGRDAERARAMDQQLAPYQALFAANGGPGQTLPGLLNVATQLQLGTPQQKAETVANLIKQFSVDVRALDNAIVGEAPPADIQQQQTIQQQVQAGIEQFKQEQARQQQQVNQRHIQTELQQFASDPKNEFYTDVRGDMAELMDMAARRNQPMTLQQAYDRAVQIHPQISQIVAARSQQKSAAQKQNAASSIAGVPGGQGGSIANATPRAALEEAWDNAGRM